MSMIQEQKVKSGIIQLATFFLHGELFGVDALHVQEILTSTDVLVGMVKATVFGFLVGIVGCYRGLKTESGPGAVGVATTRAVVTAIVLLILAEGVFSVLLYLLEL